MCLIEGNKVMFYALLNANQQKTLFGALLLFTACLIGENVV